MADLKQTAALLKDIIRETGITGYIFTLGESEKRELTSEKSEFTLYRTIYGNSVTLTVLADGRKGSASANDLSEDALRRLAKDALSGAMSAQPDAANAIAEKQPDEVFTYGSRKADMDRFYQRMEELIREVSARHPLISLNQVIGSHTGSHSLYMNSNGTVFEKTEGLYQTVLEFSGNDGTKTTGIGFAGIVMRDLDEPILAHGTLEKQLEATEKSLQTVSVGDKFEGQIILTPDALGNFAYMLIGNYLQSGVVMDGTSRWLDRLGEKVADEKITLSVNAQDDRLAVESPYTSDGYRAQNVTLIRNGRLESFLLNLFAANKTGRPVTKNSGDGLIMEPGDTPYADMVRSVRRGLIVGGFSGGHPGANGEFSGVAKNSFYVEDGRIKGAVMETMISGNLADVFSRVLAVSKEQYSDGTMSFPYLMTDGITVSGS